MNEMRKLMESVENLLNENFAKGDRVFYQPTSGEAMGERGKGYGTVVDTTTNEYGEPNVVVEWDNEEYAAMGRLIHPAHLIKAPEGEDEDFWNHMEVDNPFEALEEEEEDDDVSGMFVGDKLHSVIVDELAKIKPGFQPAAYGPGDSPNTYRVLAWNRERNFEEEMLFNTDTMSFEGSEDHFTFSNPFEGLEESEEGGELNLYAVPFYGNFYGGKYYETGVDSMFVLASSPEEAKEIGAENIDLVMDHFKNKRYRVGSRSIRAMQLNNKVLRLGGGPLPKPSKTRKHSKVLTREGIRAVDLDEGSPDRDSFRNDGADLNEARGRVVEVPPELRGDIDLVGDATSEDAARFLADLGPDDDVSHDVVDPETGELLDWPTAGLNRDEPGEAEWRAQFGGTKRERGKADYAKAQANKSDYDLSPTLYVNTRGGFDETQESAWELLNELRNSDFYNVVWSEAGTVDMDTGDEDAFADYDTEYEVPVAIKRKDGKKFTDDDHDNMREIVKAAKLGSTMQNTGIHYVGMTNGGTVARFSPSFM